MTDRDRQKTSGDAIDAQGNATVKGRYAPGVKRVVTGGSYTAADQLLHDTWGGVDTFMRTNAQKIGLTDETRPLNRINSTFGFHPDEAAETARIYRSNFGTIGDFSHLEDAAQEDKPTTVLFEKLSVRGEPLVGIISGHVYKVPLGFSFRDFDKQLDIFLRPDEILDSAKCAGDAQGKEEYFAKVLGAIQESVPMTIPLRDNSTFHGIPTYDETEDDRGNEIRAVVYFDYINEDAGINAPGAQLWVRDRSTKDENGEHGIVDGYLKLPDDSGGYSETGSFYVRDLVKMGGRLAINLKDNVNWETPANERFDVGTSRTSGF
jgi:hypothetical protein